MRMDHDLEKIAAAILSESEDELELFAPLDPVDGLPSPPKEEPPAKRFASKEAGALISSSEEEGLLPESDTPEEPRYVRMHPETAHASSRSHRSPPTAHCSASRYDRTQPTAVWGPSRHDLPHPAPLSTRSARTHPEPARAPIRHDLSDPSSSRTVPGNDRTRPTSLGSPPRTVRTYPGPAHSPSDRTPGDACHPWKTDARLNYTHPPDSRSLSQRYAEYHHLQIECVVAVRKGGYTITNRKISISCRKLQFLSYDLFRIHAKQLLFVDLKSLHLWRMVTTQLLPYRLAEQPPTDPCQRCKTLECPVGLMNHFCPDLLIPHSPDYFCMTPHVRNASLCLSRKGYTICNGRTSLYFDGHPNVRRMMYAVKILMDNPPLLYVVDEYTFDKIKYHHRVERIHVTGQCSFCADDPCHKYMAVAGMKKMLHEDLDEIPHDEGGSRC